MKFKEYFKHITGESEFSITRLRIFIFQTNKIIKKLEKSENIILFLKFLEEAVQELLNFNYGVLDLKDLLGQELFDEIYIEENFKEKSVIMNIENAKKCKKCDEWFGISELKKKLCNTCYAKVVQKWIN